MSEASKEEVRPLNLNMSNIMKKLEHNSHWLSFLASGVHRLGSIGHVMGYYAQGEYMAQIQAILEQPHGGLEWRLWKSPHLYTKLFQAGLIARLAIEGGILPAKYKKLTENVMLGSGIAAMTLPDYISMTDIGQRHGQPDESEIHRPKRNYGSRRSGVNPFDRRVG